MKKYRSSVGQRIYPVEYSSMTGNTVPHIFNSFISLDSGDDHVSREAGNRKEGAYQNNIRRAPLVSSSHNSGFQASNTRCSRDRDDAWSPAARRTAG